MRFLLGILALEHPPMALSRDYGRHRFGSRAFSIIKLLSYELAAGNLEFK